MTRLKVFKADKDSYGIVRIVATPHNQHIVFWSLFIDLLAHNNYLLQPTYLSLILSHSISLSNSSIVKGI